jgi:hypothetical protein
MVIHLYQRKYFNKLRNEMEVSMIHFQTCLLHCIRVGLRSYIWMLVRLLVGRKTEEPTNKYHFEYLRVAAVALQSSSFAPRAFRRHVHIPGKMQFATSFRSQVIITCALCYYLTPASGAPINETGSSSRSC